MSRRIGLMFPGQGSQRPGMGAPWKDRPGWALVEQGAALTGRDLPGLLLDADQETLVRTDNAQLATLALELVIQAELAAVPAVAEADVVVAAGHSLGEYGALAAAGVLDPTDALRLVDVRGRAMDRACTTRPGTMAVVIGAAPETVASVVAGVREEGHEVWVANENGPRQSVVAGTESGIDAAVAEIMNAGALKTVRIPVAGAFHTPLMSEARSVVAAAVETVEFARGRFPVVANVDGDARSGGPVWRELLREQVCSPVRWHRTLDTVQALGCDLLVEVGPGRVLGGLARSIVPGLDRAEVSTPDQLDQLAERLTAEAAVPL